MRIYIERKTVGGGGGGSAFTTIQPDAGTAPVATTSADTLTLTSSDDSVLIKGNSTTDTIDFLRAGIINPATQGWIGGFNDMAAKPEVATVNKLYGGGTIGLSTIMSGTSASMALGPTAYANRYGVVEMSLGTSAGAITAFETADDKCFRFGDGRIKVGCSLRHMQSVSGAEDYTVIFGVGNAISTFSTQGCQFYIGQFFSTTNYYVKSAGTGVTYNNTSTAYSTTGLDALEIDIAADLSSAKYYINGTLVYTETTTANLPAAGTQANFQLATRVHGTVTVVNKFEVDWMYLYKKPTNARDTLTTWLD